MHYCSLAHLKTVINKTDATNDLFIESVLNAIDARLAQLCNQNLFLTIKNLQFARTGKTTKVISNFPLFTTINSATKQPYLAQLKYTSNSPTNAGDARVWTPVTGYWEIQANESGQGGRIYYEPGFLGGMLGGGFWGTSFAYSGSDQTNGDRCYLLTYAYGQPTPSVVLYTAGSGAGMFSLTYNGQTIGNISYAATAANVQSALAAITGLFGSISVAGASLSTGLTITFSNAADALPVNVVNPAGSAIIAATANSSPVLQDVGQVEAEWAAILFKESDILGMDGGRLGVSSTTDSTPMGISHTVANKDLMPRWRMVLNAYTLQARAGW